MIYFLLLDRKKRKPALEDDDDSIRNKNEVSESLDPPRKRLDTCRLLSGNSNVLYGQISEGSPIAPRRSPFK